ncbi:ABC transporter permease [Nonomuraea endophytica]|uniref:ABC-2 type transport system permease protein n=1 Tax=Nonomuraea endophytica TaxID=714136 RepID=A0A7W8A1A7_9ACTN|nr:ABC transporter permease [Nonomuraea endophytica]MBB5077731.1 ABC-2 type transport system permease protein [Nonomuraea endophytica]
MNTLTGTGMLLRLALRRDRWMIAVWTVFTSVVPLGFVSAFNATAPTAAARQDFVDTSVHNTAFIIAYGPLHGSTLGQLVTWRAGFIPVIVGLVALLLMIRHTRTEEEAGRLELVGATAVGRHAGLAAALISVLVGSAVVSALSALALVSAGLGAGGAVVFGLGLLLTGCAFAAAGAIFAQLTAGAGGARGIAIVVLGAAFLVRGIASVSQQSGGSLGWLAWLSPVAWAGEFRPYAGDRWWIAVPCLLATAALVALAVTLAGRRDLGSGMIQPRPGPAEAAAALRTPLALAWRLHRGALFSRLAGFAVVGYALGAVAESISHLLDNSGAAARDLLAGLGLRGSLLQQYVDGMMTLAAVVAAAYAIQAALRPRAEEVAGLAEPMLATPVQRLRWAWSHFLFALLGPTLGLAVFGAVLGLAHGINAGDVAGQVPAMLGAALVQLPAVWLFTGVAVALFGLLPRLAAWAFAALPLSLFLGWLGAELQLGEFVTGLSAFSHIPKLPAEPLSVLPLAVLTAMAAALIAAGSAGIRGRDLPIG